MYNCLKIVPTVPENSLRSKYFFRKIHCRSRPFSFFFFLPTKKRNLVESGKGTRISLFRFHNGKGNAQRTYFEFHNVASTWEKKSAGLTNCPPRDIDGGLTAVALRVRRRLFLNYKNEILLESRRTPPSRILFFLFSFFLFSPFPHFNS